MTTKKFRIPFTSSRLKVFFKKGVLRNFVKFTEKHLKTPVPETLLIKLEA